MLPTPEVSQIRERHEILDQLANELTQPEIQLSATALADSRQDFRAINSFGRDIDFFLAILIKQFVIRPIVRCP